MEVRSRFKGLDLIDRVPDELWMEVLMVALRSQGNWRWEGPLGTPLGLVHWKRASSPVEAGTAGYL